MLADWNAARLKIETDRRAQLARIESKLVELEREIASGSPSGHALREALYRQREKLRKPYRKPAPGAAGRRRR
jgi:hypothetical protein